MFYIFRFISSMVGINDSNSIENNDINNNNNLVNRSTYRNRNIISDVNILCSDNKFKKPDSYKNINTLVWGK